MTARWTLLETSMWVNIQRIIGVSHCANVVWLEDCPELIILLLRDRIEEVIVAASAIHGNAEKRLGGMLDGAFEPDVADVPEPVARQEAAGPAADTIMAITYRPVFNVKQNFPWMSIRTAALRRWAEVGE